MSADDSKYDGAFLDVLSSCGRPERLLDAVFAFLYRRTDFYRVINSTQPSAHGFPPGYASKVAFKAFDKYEKLAREDDKKKAEVEAKAAVLEDIAREEVVDIGGEQVKLQRRGDEIVIQADGVASGATKKNSSSAAKDSADAFNGAARDNYSWTQTQSDIDVRVNVTRQHSKFAVSCAGGKRLHVTALKDGERETLVEGDLINRIKESETVWTVVPGEHIHISLEKADEKWWDSLLTNEAKISLNELDVTKPFEELDVEEQMKIRQLQQESIERLQGKMEAKKQDINEMLKTAWNAEGSPFQGSEYDPSKVSVDPAGNMFVNASPSQK